MYDFSGYATKNDLECADGRIIRHDAFKDNDGTRVPLVWAHIHNTPDNVLGHADLENRDDGVYAFCSFNDTPQGLNAKTLVQHGDINSMSIYANNLKQHGPNVIHGIIREVSLVMAGANPGALIDPVSIKHSADDGSYTYTDLDDEAIIYTGEEFLEHTGDKEDKPMADEKDKTPEEEPKKESKKERSVQDVIDTMNEEQRNVLRFLVGQALEEGGSKEKDDDDDEVKHSADDAEDAEDSDEKKSDKKSDKTVQDVLDGMTEEQRTVVAFLVGQALNDKNNAGSSDKGEVKHSGMEANMKHNIFDNTDGGIEELTKEDVASYIDEAKHNGNGSLRSTFKAHGVGDVSYIAHGVENIDVLYPEARLVGDNPAMIARDTTWVDKVWGAVKKTPFARIKSVAANITEYEARARGYVKGNQKIEEVISLLGRRTEPQTVYKLQKIDRDDVIDIVDLDIVAWMKNEMRLMLNEEIVRAILVGDDRPSNDPSRIHPENIRPIYQDSDVYTIHDEVTIGSSATFNDIADAIIEHAVLARKNYKGSGVPTMYASTDIITRMLLAKDTLGHRMYRNEAELASALRVKEIVEVPIFDGIKRVASITTEEDGRTVTTTEERKLLALIVNLTDYSVGTDRGGEVNLFDDFDLDFNKYEYLLETRCSGALTAPYSAIAIETAGELPFTFGTVSGMYENSKTAKAAAGGTGETGDTGITG